MYTMLVSVCVVLAVVTRFCHGTIVADEQMALQQFIDSVTECEGGIAGVLADEWQQPLINACSAPFPGLTCLSVLGPITNFRVSSTLKAGVLTLGWKPEDVDWTKFTALVDLRLNRGGNMKGTIPTQYPFGLNYLYIGEVQRGSALTGTIPSEIFSLAILQKFKISNMFVTGTIPSSIESSTSLETVFFQKLPDLGGTLPAIGFIDDGTPLNFRLIETDIEGTIPAALCSGNRVFQEVRISSNPQIIDPLPDCFRECDTFVDDPICQIYDNDLCEIGIPADEELAFIADQQTRFGIAADDDDDDCDIYPCDISRDRRDCLGCDGEENSGSTYDECGVCLPPDSEDRDDSCRDCAGEPNGDHVYDRCDVCDGDGTSCLDCNGVPFGTSEYDECGVCDGGNSDMDCMGLCFGTALYDRCGVCNGCDFCVDCRNVPHGTSEIDCCGICEGLNQCLPCPDHEKDECGVCHGDNDTCLDCAGTPNGTAEYDLCGVCNGGNACVDCAAVVDGTSVHDACGVCGGDGNSCLDCAGVPNGTSSVDMCGVCGGDDACLDCAGTMHGFAAYDVCDVCNGDGTSCLDCAGLPNGTSQYDDCDVCGGDGQHPCPPLREHELGEKAERHFTEIGLWIFGGTLICCIVTLMCIYLIGLHRISPRRTVMHIHRDDTRPPRQPPQQQQQQRFLGEEEKKPPPRYPKGGGGIPVSRNVFVILALLGLVASAACTAQGTAQFFDTMTSKTNAAALFPSWLDGGGDAKVACDGSEVGLVCDVGEGVIVGVDIDAPLVGDLDTEPLLSYLPYATSIWIANAPQFHLVLDGVEDSHNLERLVLTNVGVRGTLPEDLGELRKLRVLRITEGELEGELPPSMCNMNCIKTIELRDNKLTCTLPDDLVDNWQDLEVLDLRANQCYGMLPYCLSFSEKMRCLWLDNNKFNGTVPQVWALLPALEKLGVSSNQLEGDTFLFLESSGKQHVEVYLDNNCFGPTLPDLSGFTQLEKLGISHNKFSESYDNVEGLFDIGSPFGPLKLLKARNNSFEQLSDTYDDQHFCGVCDFRDNWLCRNDDIAVPPIYHILQCDFNLFSNVCGTKCGDMSCVDCYGVVHGSATYDVCDVCGGDDTSCADCNYVPNGSSVYDECGVCDGDGSTCRDCAGVPAGSSSYDRCDVCNGDDTACADCAGVPNGGMCYDECDVCGGDHTSCRDCDGVVNGTAQKDECGVCNGDGSTCAGGLAQDVAALLSSDDDSHNTLIVCLIGAAVLFIGSGALLCIAWRSARKRRQRLR